MNQAFQAIRRQASGAETAQLPARSFPDLLERSKHEIARALPRHLNADRMARIALTAFRGNARLAECSPISVLAAVVQASQLGLEIGLMGEAYLVPFKVKRNGQWIYECQLIPGYAGLMKLARQSGMVADIYAHEVRENDDFKLRLGMSRELIHEPLPGKGGFPATEAARGEITGFYAVCVFKDGSNTFVALSVADAIRIRDRSNGYKAAKQFGRDTPWDTDFPEMGKKTAIRALAKMIPKSPELATALAMDNAAEAGLSQNINLQQAADGTYEPVAPEAGDLPDGESEGEEAATPPSAAVVDLPARAQAQVAPHAQAEGDQRKRVEQTAQRTEVNHSKGEAATPAARQTAKVTASAFERYLDQMKVVTNEDALNEAYLRAEAGVRTGADQEILDREYTRAKERLDSRGLFGN